MVRASLRSHVGKPSYASEWSGCFYPGFSGFRPPLMNVRLNISEIVLKGPKNPNQKKKKKKKKKVASILRTPICLFVLRFYGPVNPMGSCRSRSVYLTTRLLGRLSPLSGSPVLCTFFRQKLTTALLESAEGRE